MKIDELTVGTLAYTIRCDSPDGELVENNTRENPKSLFFGIGRVMKSFYDELHGLTEGDIFSFAIDPGDAYGEHDSSLVTDVPLDYFYDDGVLQVELTTGNRIGISYGEGKVVNGTVIGVAADHVVMDFNHPMAGHKLFVSGEVLGVRKPTIDEMNEAVEHEHLLDNRHSHHHHHHG